jgi:hypothetical protein
MCADRLIMEDAMQASWSAQQGRSDIRREADGPGGEAATIPPRSAGDHAQPRGLRHIFAHGGVGAPCALGRLAVASPWRAKRILASLARMSQSSSSGDEDDENPDIPSGYTYLLQLMSHDLVASNVSASIVRGARYGFANARREPLTLETIYGAGPNIDPPAYELCDAAGGPIWLLKVGRIAGPGACPFRDIARVARSSRESNAGFDGRRGAQALVCDARNDDHAILSQLCLFFHLTHNHLSARVAALKPLEHVDWQQRAFRIYLATRLAIALAYRRILREDVMRRLLHPDVWSFYARRGWAPLEPEPDLRTPVELSHGVLRIGHAMVRRGYVVNAMTDEPISILEALGQSGARAPYTAPITQDWVVSWSRFFDMGRRPLNFSRRLGPTYAPALVDKKTFPAIDDDATVGLAFRDLSSSAHLGVHSAASLFDLARKCGAAEVLPPEHERRLPVDVRNWMENRARISAMAADDIGAVAVDPPLPLLTLVEAASDPDGGGRRLGRLGSVILAESLLGLMRSHPIAPNAADDAPSQIAAMAAEQLQDGAAFQEFGRITQMPDLLAYMREHAPVPDGELALV